LASSRAVDVGPVAKKLQQFQISTDCRRKQPAQLVRRFALGSRQERFMVIVHNYKVWDSGCGGWVYPLLKATADKIKKARGEIIAGTNENVYRSKLDAEGRYCPAQTKSGSNRLKIQDSGRRSADIADVTV
jgi:hypothetical protein